MCDPIDPVRLTKIKHHVVNKMIRKYWRLSLDRSELLSEAELVVMDRVPRYKQGWGNIYCYLHTFLMFELGKFVQRKVIPNTIKVAGMHVVNICSSDLKYDELNPREDCTKQVEARDCLEKIKTVLNEKDLELYTLMEHGLNQSEIARVLNISRQGVNNRLRKIRKKSMVVLTD